MVIFMMNFIKISNQIYVEESLKTFLEFEYLCISGL